MSLLKIKYQVKKEILIESDSKTVFDYLIDGKKKSVWSPWFVLDRDCSITKKGSEGTKGYAISWNSTLLGEGTEEIVEIKAGKSIKTKLTFIKPQPSEAEAVLMLEEKEGLVKVSWTLTSTLPIFVFFMKSKIEAMLGEDFRRGLVMLKDYVEKSKLETSSIVDGVDKVETFYYIGINGKASSFNLHEETSFKFNNLLEYCNEKSVNCTTLMTIYEKVDLENDEFDFTCGLLVSEDEYDRLLSDFSHDEIFMGRYNATDCLKLSHKGSYHYLPNSWTLGYMYIKAEKLALYKKSPAVEVYKNRLEGLEEEDLVTELFIPIIE